MITPSCKDSWMSEHLLTFTAFGAGPPEHFHAMRCVENRGTCFDVTYCQLASGQWLAQVPPGCRKGGRDQFLGHTCNPFADTDWKAPPWSQTGKEEGCRTEQAPLHMYRLRDCIFNILMA